MMRPQSITFLCAILFVIGFSMTIRSIGQFIMMGSLYTFLMVIISLLGLYAYYGLWNMKRWCIPLFYLVWGVISLPMFIGGDPFTTIKLVRALYLISVMVIYIVVVTPHRNKFSSGLVWPLGSKQK